MSDSLTDPTKPPHALVETRDDGSARRNDGVELKAANENPWYRLATVHGEQTGDEIDLELHAKNRRIWNGWACSEMDDAERAALAERLVLAEEELVALSVAELAQARARLQGLDAAAFGEAGPGPDGLPNLRNGVPFGKSYFPNALILGKCVFSDGADFEFATFCGLADFGSATFRSRAVLRSATFSDGADFGSATFGGLADFGFATFSGWAAFESATFSDGADFGSATFCDRAYFVSAWFSGIADFEYATFSGVYFVSTTFSGLADFASVPFSGLADFVSATFNGGAYFVSATFSDPAIFDSTTFNAQADFSDGSFGAQTTFKAATFATRVPRFYLCEMHQDTTFTTRNENWPRITEDNAEDGKPAYARLRQLMKQLDRPDDAHFFSRQEMCCKAFLRPDRSGG